MDGQVIHGAGEPSFPVLRSVCNGQFVSNRDGLGSRTIQFVLLSSQLRSCMPQIENETEHGYMSCVQCKYSLCIQDASVV